MRVWDAGGLSDALVTVLDDISSSPCNDTDQKHHQMYHFQTWIQWQQTVRKQRPGLSIERKARTWMIRAVGEAWLLGWWIIICAMGTMPAKIAMCPPVTWSDQLRMFTRRFPFSLSLIFTTSECKASGCNYCLLFLSRPVVSSCLERSPVLSKCEYGNSLKLFPECWLCCPLFFRHQHLSSPPLQVCPLSPPLRSLSLSGPVSESLQVSQLLCDARPVNISQTLTTHSHDTQVRIVKMSSVIKIFSDVAFWNSCMECIS